MRLPFSPQFLVERAQFPLLHCCEDCVYWVQRRGASMCLHEWPNELHRRARYEQGEPDLVFCKEFESS